ncbi:DUF5709 domain-containing protein [Streptomyces sp. NPDC091268]|uniref:DUF5709 domain-containing protein n=1 Tax=Streptomyces sp. NPDC091268 TaxID=3365979 RepID=UPI0038218BB6
MSTTAPHSDDVYQPDDPDDPAQAQPDMENALDEPGLDESLDSGYSPPEKPWAVNDHGTTAEEAHLGESLDRRLAREVADTDPDADSRSQDGAGEPDRGEFTGEAGETPQSGPVRTGRLAPSEESGPGHNLSVRAHDVGINGGAASAEEAAMHLIEEEDEEDAEGETEGGSGAGPTDR